MPVSGFSTRSPLARQNLRPIQIKTVSWEVGEAARAEDLQGFIKEASGNASVAVTKKVPFCPLTEIYSKLNKRKIGPGSTISLGGTKLQDTTNMVDKVGYLGKRAKYL